MPLLFLDVDGPLIPFGGTSIGVYGSTRPEPGTNPLLARIDPALGPLLRALPCELVWATSWGEDANAEVAPYLGLPRLPVVHWTDDGPGPRLHWKTRTIVEWADGRPFVWIDDEIGEQDRTWVAAAHPGLALLHLVAPQLGLTSHDLETVRRWLLHPSRRNASRC